MPSAATRLSGINVLPVSKEHKIDNVKILLKVFKDIYGDNVVSFLELSRFIGGSQLEFILLLTFLHQTLPCFQPRGSIELTAHLHATTSKIVELANPTTRPVNYTASLYGDPEFSLKENAITLLPKTQNLLTIDFQSRFQHEVTSLLVLKGRKMGFNLSSILSYTLIGNVENTGPQEIFEMRASMYCNPPSILKMPVSNPFASDCSFIIRVSTRTVIIF